MRKKQGFNSPLGRTASDEARDRQLVPCFCLRGEQPNPVYSSPRLADTLYLLIYNYFYALRNGATESRDTKPACGPTPTPITAITLTTKYTPRQVYDVQLYG